MLLRKILVLHSDLFKNIFDNIDLPIGILSFDYDKISKILYVNQHTAKFVGYTFEQIYEMSPYDLLEAINSSSSDKLRADLFNKQSIKIELFVKTKHKGLIPVEIHLSIIKLDENYYVNFILYDNSEKFKIKNKLSYQENLFLKVWDSSFNAMLLTDENGLVIDINQKFSDVFNFTSNDIIGKNISEIFPGDVRNSIKAQYSEFLTNLNKPKKIEFKYQNNNNEIKILQSQSEIVIDDQGNKFLLSIIEDVTDSRSRELIIEKSEKHFRTLFLSINNPVFIHKHSGLKEKSNFIEVNNHAVKTYGYSREEFLTLSPADITFETSTNIDEINRINQEFDRIGYATFQLTHIHKSGRKLPVEISASKVFLDDDYYILSIARDISNRIDAQKKIIDLNRRIEASMLAGNMAWWEMELPSGRIDFNDNKTEMLGYKKENFMHYWDFMNIVHPQDHDKVNQSMRDHLQGKADVYEIEYRIKHRKGNYLWFHDIGKITEKKGENLKISGIVTNITEKKQIQEILDNERKQFISLLDSIPENIYIADIENFNILYTNQAFKKNLNIQSTDGKKCYELIHNRQSPCDICFNETISKSDEPIYHESYYEANQRYYYQIIRSIRWNNIQKARFEMAIDISKIKEAELTLQNLNASKDKFFTIISHDLRGPFSGFLGLTELLSKETESISIGDLKSISKAVFESATNVYSLIDQLLIWATSQSGTLPFKPIKMNVCEIIEQNARLLKPYADSKSISVDILCGNKFIVECDSNMIMTVMRNLVTNAIKFSNQHSSIKISGELVNNDSYVQISVVDSGIGMNSEFASKLFKVENKVSRPGTKGEKGTGLGLILCKDFVERHKGKIWVKSEEGRGSTFTFTLPTKKES